MTLTQQRFYFNLMSNVILGAALSFAFAPYSVHFLAILSLFGLCFLWERSQTVSNAFTKGFSFGLGLFGTGVSWVYISIHNYGNSNIAIGLSITVGFIAILSLFPAMLSACFTKFFPENQYHPALRMLLILPSLWALTDFFRSVFLTGFPWLLLGHSQTSSLLSGFAPIVGVYGMTFLVVFSAGILYLIARYAKIKHYFNVVILTLCFTVLLITGSVLSKVDWTKPLPKPLEVYLIQGNVPIELKWSPDYALKSFQFYEQSSEKILSLSNDKKDTLIIWPETAVTFFLHEAKPLLKKLNEIAQKHHASIITGIPIADINFVNPAKNHFYNGAILLGMGSGIYLKQHLVPFGEYTPLENWLGKILKFLNIPLSDLNEGPPDQALFHTFGLNIAPLICYEAAYTNLLKADVPRANIFTIISNDSWFGKSAALGQQREIAQFAALMTQRYVVVATNSGETIVINPQGKIIAQSPIDTISVLQKTVYGMTGETPWITLGDEFYWVLFILFLCMARLLKQSP